MFFVQFRNFNVISFFCKRFFYLFCEKILWETGVFSDAGNAKAKAALTQGRAAFFRFRHFVAQQTTALPMAQTTEKPTGVLFYFCAASAGDF